MVTYGHDHMLGWTKDLADMAEQSKSALEGKGPKHLGNRWYKGMPGPNPHGRPKTGLAFSEMARDRDKMEERFAVVLALALGQPVLRAYDADGNPIVTPIEPGKPVRAEIVWATPEIILRANEFINSWAYQKPPTQVEVTTKDDESGYAWDKLDEDRRAKLIELFALGAPTGTTENLAPSEQPAEASLAPGDESPALPETSPVEALPATRESSDEP